MIFFALYAVEIHVQIFTTLNRIILFAFFLFFFVGVFGWKIYSSAYKMCQNKKTK